MTTEEKRDSVEITTLDGFDVIRNRRAISNITTVRQPIACKQDDMRRFPYSKYAEKTGLLHQANGDFDHYDDIRKLRDTFGITIKDEREIK